MRVLRILAFAALLGACGRTAVDRVVVVTIDTLRADFVGSYGGRFSPTPNLDAIATAGVRFETVISPAPITLPSHVSLFTALDPPQHGVRNNSTFRLDSTIPTLAERFREGGLATAAFVASVVLDRQFGLDRGFDLYDDRMSWRRNIERGFAERSADEVTDSVIDWLEGAPEAFLLWVHYYDPHALYDPPTGCRNPLRYACEVTFVDEQLGRLVGALDSRFEAAGTLLVVTSDHGESLGEHGEDTHAYTLYDATQRVPLLMRGGVPAGAVVTELVRLVDVAPTLIDLAELEPLPGTSGRSLVPLLAGGSLPEAPAYLETLAPQIDLGWSPLLGLRTPDWKYVRAPRPELYALAADPLERENVAVARPEQMARLDAELTRRLAGARPVQPRGLPEPDDRARLEGLGYVVAPAHVEPSRLGKVGGADPKDLLPILRTLGEAQALAASGRAEEALARVAGIESGGLAVAITKAEVALAAGAWQAAEQFAREAVATAPGFAWAHFTLGEALEGNGKPEDAREAFERAAELDPAAGEPYVGLGRLAEARDEPERAVAYYERAADSRTKPAEALWRLAALRFEAGERRAAADLVARLPERERTRPDAALRLAAAESATGRTGAAISRLRGSLRQHPWHAGLKDELATLRGSPGAEPTAGSPAR